MLAAPLAEEIVELVASGVDVYVATRDADLEPESMMAMGLRIHPDRRGLTVYLPETLAKATVENLEANGEIAVSLIRPSDFKAVQIKGRFKSMRPSNELDRELQMVFRAALVEQMQVVGVPRSVTRRLVWWPSLAIDVIANDVFMQTPGPGAGERMAAQ